MLQSKQILARLYLDYYVINNAFFIDTSFTSFKSTSPDGVRKSRVFRKV